LVAKGYIPDRAAAFTDLLSPHSRFYVPHYAPDPLTGVRLIRAAGGVPVIAHPATAGRGRVIDEAYLAELARAGLFGVEVDHRENRDAGKEWLKHQARLHAGLRQSRR
ncbi:MAG TPA: phosphatase, partial [Kribbella sp.]